jgi:hypothetical protein
MVQYRQAKKSDPKAAKTDEKKTTPGQGAELFYRPPVVALSA